MNFDHMPYSNTPHFTDPWAQQQTTAPAPSHSIYATSHSRINPNMGLDNLAKQQHQQQQQQQQQQQTSRLNTNVSMGSYSSVPITAAAAGSSLLTDVYGSQQDLLTMPQDMLSPSRPLSTGYGNESAAYSSAPSPVHTSFAPTSSPYDSMGYVPTPVRSTYGIPQQDSSRRLSQPSVPSTSFDALSDERLHRQNSLIDFNDRGLQSNDTSGFREAIDAGRGMLAMSQNTTPRNIYGGHGRVGRGSGDSYGFPPTHSNSSSISSSGNYPSYFGGSVDSSVSDYSNAGSDIESVSSRTLPRPSGLLNGGAPPAPQSMMGQFSSKVSSSTQKKHKCKVCDKRFTRPSSLQTHMYSHTGEKRKF